MTFSVGREIRLDLRGQRSLPMSQKLFVRVIIALLLFVLSVIKLLDFTMRMLNDVQRRSGNTLRPWGGSNHYFSQQAAVALGENLQHRDIMNQKGS
jgi:hypothetical protein